MTIQNRSSGVAAKKWLSSWVVLAGSLGIILIGMFHRSFEKGQALFSNDGPLAIQAADIFRMPEAFFGIWNDLYWLGVYSGAFSPNITGLLVLVLGPFGYTNFHLPISLFILGLCAWFFFRTLGFGAMPCVLGGLAAAFNMNFFSNGAWGLSSRALCLAMVFLALAAIQSSFKGRPLLKMILAGLAIGMSILEAGDNGAIFSLFVAAYAFYRVMFQDRPLPARFLRGIGWVAIMAVSAAVLASNALNVFVDVAVTDVAGAQQDAETKQAQWDWATQWSLPKMETLRVIIPGLYGYRLDTPEGGAYWGAVGRSPHWTPGSPLTARHSGAGEYAGVLVVLVGIWTLAQAGRRDKSVFTVAERRHVWFWGGAALAALLLAWGRFAPFYQFLYALPYLSTIRSPMKFMHPFHMALMILFAYGLQGLSRLYLERAAATGSSLRAQIKRVWAQGNPFEKRWTMATVAVTGLSALSYLIYSASRPEMIHHLTQVGFGETEAQAIARFSAGEVGMFVVVLALSVAVLIAVQSGWFGGRRALWAGSLLGLILVADLVRSDTPWIRYYDYEERYATNPIIDVLKDKPYEHRVTVVPFGGSPQLANFQQFYHVEWLQHHFPFYNIQSLDVAQDPRPPEDKTAYMSRATSHVARYWQLTNTRYLLGMAGNLIDLMNQQLAPQEKPFRLAVPFTIESTPHGHFKAKVTEKGPFALIEMTNALPRARLYARWEVLTNQQAVLDRLFSPEFDPTQSVLLAEDLPSPPADATPAPTSPGSAEFVHYSPRAIDLHTRAQTATVLLLNDHYYPSWEIQVDGQPAHLLRCNFIMRGVYLPPGDHDVAFRFAPAVKTFFISLSALILGLLLLGYMVLMKAWGRPTAPAPEVKEA